MTILHTTLMFIILSLTSTISFVTSQDFDIVDILSGYPEYSEFNNYLLDTKLNDEINNRLTITVLVLNNTLVRRFLANQPLSVVKTALSIHVLLDFYDMPKLLALGGGSVSTTTLYQTTGNAAGSTGFVNITDLAGNKVAFGSGQGAKLDSLYLKTVKSMPYNISVLEISSPIIPPGILVPNGEALPNVNVTSVIEHAGCKTFARLLSQTGVWKVYDEVKTKGLTVFAPTDAAFKASGLPNLNNMTNTEFNSLLMYHAIPSYVPRVSLKYEEDPISTLASNEIEKFYLSIRTNGDSSMLNSGVDESRVENMVFDSVPICVFKINTVLLPSNLFNKSPSSGPGPTIAPAPAPKTSTPDDKPAPESPSAPAPRSIAKSPSPVPTTSPIVSPPAPVDPSTDPSTLSPDGVPAPAEGPAADTDDTKSEASSDVKASIMFLALVMVSISGFIVA